MGTTGVDRAHREGLRTVTPQRVFVFALVGPDKNTPKEKRRYKVRWRVDGRDRKRTFKTKAEADRFRSQLIHAVGSGSLFDLATGLPADWSVSQQTWWTWSQEWLGLKWPGWSGNSRRSSVESLVALTPHMVRPGAAPVPAELGHWLRQVGFAHGVKRDDGSASFKWLQRNSVLLAELRPSTIEDALTAATTKRDGGAMATEVIRRRRNTLNAALKMAVRRGHLAANPMEKIEWKVPDRTIAIDITTVPSFRDIKAIVDFTLSSPGASARYGALFACVGFAGVRPSEAMGLRLDDLTMPATGWGEAILRGATTAPGARFSDGPGAHEDKELKQRAIGDVRVVPLPPPLVSYLREHLSRFPPAGNRVFTTSTGNPMSSTSYSAAWKRARSDRWPSASSTFARATLYDLRHSAATLMLRSGIVPAEVARRLGHSVDVLMRTYAGVLDDEVERSNSLFETELDDQLNE